MSHATTNRPFARGTKNHQQESKHISLSDKDLGVCNNCHCFMDNLPVVRNEGKTEIMCEGANQQRLKRHGLRRKRIRVNLINKKPEDCQYYLSYKSNNRPIKIDRVRSGTKKSS